MSVNCLEIKCTDVRMNLSLEKSLQCCLFMNRENQEHLYCINRKDELTQRSIATLREE